MAEAADVVVERAFIVSDLHIQRASNSNARTFVEFLRLRVAPDPSATLVIAGDLFDFWYGMPAGPPAPIASIVEELEALPRVIWVEGNHDLRLERGLGRSSRIDVRPRSVVVRCGSNRLWVEHGDLISRSGRWMRRLLTSPLAELGARAITSRGTWELGNFVGRRSKPEAGYPGQSKSWLETARAHASSRRDAGFAWTVMGHGHWLGTWEAERLICLGDWLHFYSYLEVVRDAPPVLRRFDRDQPSDLPSSRPK
jgi:UDP-2,3-diacylglucosamine pyrophosphatase LpxH